MKRPPAHAAGHQRAHAALVAIALGDDDGPAPRGQRVDLEMRGGPFDLGDQAEGVADGEVAQTLGQGPAIALRGRERRQQPIQRPVLAEEEDFVLAAKVVIEVRGGQVGGDRDVAHAGGGEAAVPEDLRRRAQNVHPARVGTNRTTVRKLNHRSILADYRFGTKRRAGSRPSSARSGRSAIWNSPRSCPRVTPARKTFVYPA